MRLLKSHALRAGITVNADERLTKADQEYQEWLRGQGIRHPAVLMKARTLQGSIDFNGLQISIETGRSRVREWKDPHNDTSGMSRMTLPYGYIKGTMGTDGDHLDIFVGPDHQAPEVYVVHTNKPPAFDSYDEDKCFVGLNSPEEAMRHFRAAYDDPRFFGSMSVWTFEEFKVAAFSLQGKRLDNTRHIPPAESLNGIKDGPGRLFTETELRQRAQEMTQEPMKKSGEAMCKQLGDTLGIDWKKYSLDEFCDGMFVEDGKYGSSTLAAVAVLAHLDEDPEYYSHLQTAKNVELVKSLLASTGR